MIELFGQERYLKERGGTLIASDSFGRLWKKGLWNDEAIVMIELLNSTPERDGSLSVGGNRHLRGGCPGEPRRDDDAFGWSS